MRTCIASLALLASLAGVLSLSCADSTTAPAAETLPTSTSKIVFFGDSITGHRPQTEYRQHYIKFSDLTQLMAEAHVGLGGVESVNCGYAADATFERKGQQLPGAINRVEKDILDLKPDIAVILIGANDNAKTAEEKERTRKNLETIFGKAKKAGIKVLALQYHEALPAPENRDQAWWHLDDVNPLIRAAAKKHSVPTLNMNKPMQQADRKYPREQLVDPRDGVHLRPRGEMIYARAIFGRLKELGWLK
ncbi:MAG: SGNH/GDSL hydrolase family protein [Phycisphaerae bacterium]